MGSYRASVGHRPILRVEKDSPSFAGNDIGFSLTTGVPQTGADFVIPAGTAAITFDGFATTHPNVVGPSRAAVAGDVIEFATGTHGTRTISRVVGSSSSRITVRGPQTAGQALFTSSATFMFIVEACRYVTIDGETTSTDAPLRVDGKRHGIKLVAPGAHTAMIKFRGTNQTTQGNTALGRDANGYDMTRDITLRYLELDGNWTNGVVGVGGIGISTNDGGMALSTYPTSWQESIVIEHCYIHNTRAEGMYVGGNAYKHVRGSQPPEVPLRHIKARYNWLVDVGGDGINFKSVFGGTPGADGATENSIHDNVLIRCGSNTVDNNGNDSIAPRSAKANIYNNWVEGGGGWGINPSVAEGTNVGDPSGVYTWKIYNNVVRNCGVVDANRGGIHAFFYSTSQPPTVYAFNNSAAQNSNSGTGIEFAGGVLAASFIRNNVCVGNTTNITFGGGLSEPSKNSTAGTAASVFVNTTGTKEAGTIDFHLQAGIGVTGGSVLGTDVALRDLDDDSDRVLVNADMGAYEYP